MSAIAAGMVLSAGIGAYSSNKAAKTAAGAAQASKVDLDALDAKAREVALRNARESKALQDELTPEVSALQKQSIEGLTGAMAPSSTDQYTQNLLAGSLGERLGTANAAGTAMSPLLQAAIAKAKANLALGGQLDVDTVNSVTRAGLSRTGRNMGGLGLGRDVVARDLGLTSYGIGNERLKQAAELGQQESDMNKAQAGLDFQSNEANNQLAFNNAANLINKIQLLRSLSDSSYNRYLGAANLGQSIAAPVVGLDPGAMASAATGNAANASAALSNKANIYGAQGQGFTNLAGNLAGYGMLNYMNSGSGQTLYPKDSNAAFYGLPTKK